MAAAAAITGRVNWVEMDPMRLVIGLRMKLGAGILALGLLVILMAPAAGAAVPPEQDPFYSYEGSTPLANIVPGTVLKTRTLSYHVAGVPLPVTAVQLLYRSTGETGAPTVNVTSVLEPPLRLGSPTVVSYQSFYDSLSPEADPSYAISGGASIGGSIPTAESGLIAPAEARKTISLFSAKAIPSPSAPVIEMARSATNCSTSSRTNCSPTSNSMAHAIASNPL